MKVLIVTTSFPRWKNDYQAPFIYELARNLQKKGIFVRVLAVHSQGSSTYELLDDIEVIRVRYLPNRWEILHKEEGGIPTVVREKPFAALALIPLFISLLLYVIRYSRDCDLIHTQWTLAAFSTWLGHPFHHKPFLVTVHGSDLLWAGKVSIFAKFMAVALNHSSGVIAVSKALSETAKQIGVKSNLIHTIPDGVDITRFEPGLNKREKLFLTVGSATPNKGGDILVSSLCDIFNKFPEYKAVWIGEGPERLVWQEIADNSGIGSKIFFIGSQTQEEVSNYLKKAYLFILPSRSEGLGVVLLEALASGVPCIGSDVGGIPDIITCDVGRLYHPNTSDALSLCICDLLLKPEEIELMRINAREKIIWNYSWNIIIDKILNIYQNILLINK